MAVYMPRLRTVSLVALAYQLKADEEAEAARRPRQRRAEAEKTNRALAHPKDLPVEHEGYRRLVAALPCKNCGRQRRSQAAHLPPDGKAIKRDDRLTFPLCADGPRSRGCHPKFDQYELMPREQAVKQGLKWAAETRAEIEAAGEWPRGLPRYQPTRRKTK